MNRQHYVEVPVVEFSIVVMGYYIQFVISYFIIVNMKTVEHSGIEVHAIHSGKINCTGCSERIEFELI